MIPIDSDTKKAVWAIIKRQMDKFRVPLPDGDPRIKEVQKIIDKHYLDMAISYRIKHARSRLKKHCYKDEPEEVLEIICAARAEAECYRVADFVNELDMLCFELKCEPIQTDSGTFEPRYGPQRTYQDMENEVATKLSTQDPYMARVKILKEVGGKFVAREYLLQTLPLAPGISEAALEARFKRIQNRTRQLYCKPRAQVEAQITARQQKLLDTTSPATSGRTKRVG